MSSENYRILNYEEVQQYENCDWFMIEVKSFITAEGTRWLVPEKRVLKDLDKKGFFRRKLEELLDEFDFARVHDTMDVLGWHWANVDGIPEKDDMIPLVRSLYDAIEDRVLNEEYAFCATGGFKLTFNPEEDNELNLVFEAEACSVYGN